MQIFYSGSRPDSMREMDLAGGGRFTYKTPNNAYKMMEDLLTEKVDSARVVRDRRMTAEVKQLDFTSSSSFDTGLESKVRNLTDDFNKRMGRVEKDVHFVRQGCENCGGPHYVTDCEQLEEVNFVQNKFNSSNNFQKSN